MPRTDTPNETPASTPIELRAHHLLCALTFRSRGYGPNFVQRFATIIDQLQLGLTLQLGVSADTLCDSGENCGQCHAASSKHRDKLALSELQELLPDEISHARQLRLNATTLNKLRHAYRQGSIRSACADCAWSGFCDTVAADNFRRARLQLRP